MKSLALLVAPLLLAAELCADPVAVRHVQGYFHGFLVLKDTEGKTRASEFAFPRRGAGSLPSSHVHRHLIY